MPDQYVKIQVGGNAEKRLVLKKAVEESFLVEEEIQTRRIVEKILKALLFSGVGAKDVEDKIEIRRSEAVTATRAYHKHRFSSRAFLPETMAEEKTAIIFIHQENGFGKPIEARSGKS